MKVLRAKDRKGLTNVLHGWQERRQLSMRNATASGDICAEMSTPGLAPASNQAPQLADNQIIIQLISCCVAIYHCDGF